MSKSHSDSESVDSTLNEELQERLEAFRQYTHELAERHTQGEASEQAKQRMYIVTTTHEVASALRFAGEMLAGLENAVSILPMRYMPATLSSFGRDEWFEQLAMTIVEAAEKIVDIKKLFLQPVIGEEPSTMPSQPARSTEVTHPATSERRLMPHQITPMDEEPPRNTRRKGPV